MTLTLSLFFCSTIYTARTTLIDIIFSNLHYLLFIVRLKGVQENRPFHKCTNQLIVNKFLAIYQLASWNI